MRSLLIAILLFLCISCSTTKVVEVEVPVETVRTEYVNNIQYDSIHVIDSIDRFIKGDTVFLYKYRDVFKCKYNTDTVVKVDSIQVPVRTTITKEVEVNKIKGYQYFLMYSGLAFILCLLFAAYKLIKKFINFIFGTPTSG